VPKLTLGFANAYQDSGIEGRVRGVHENVDAD
jgi:hypothetical protein